MLRTPRAGTRPRFASLNTPTHLPVAAALGAGLARPAAPRAAAVGAPLAGALLPDASMFVVLGGRVRMRAGLAQSGASCESVR